MFEPTNRCTDSLCRLLLLCSARNVQQTKGAAGIQKVSISHSISAQCDSFITDIKNNLQEFWNSKSSQIIQVTLPNLIIWIAMPINGDNILYRIAMVRVLR